MTLHPPTVLLAVSAALVLASGAAASIGVQQRLRRGVWWWIGANLGLAVALALHALEPTSLVLAPLASALALQWPIVTLTGLRRFFSRGGAGVPPWADALVLCLALVAVIGTWLAPFDGARPQDVFAGAMFVVTLFTAVAVWRLEDFATTPVLKSLVVGLVCSALVQALAFSIAAAGLAELPVVVDTVLVTFLATAAIALLMPQLSLVMNHERNVEHLRASHRKLRHLVEVDPLTRLPNRRHFHELAKRAIKVAPEAAALVVFDVDCLKHINDVLGHSVGDEALRQVGNALRETLRRRDVAGRLGGDEFAAVLPRTKVSEVPNVVARINARLDDRQVAPRIARVVLNVGATQMTSGESIADALRRAEIDLEAQRDAARAKRAAAKPAAAPRAVAIPAAAPPPSFLVSASAPLLPVGEVVG